MTWHNDENKRAVPKFTCVACGFNLKYTPAFTPSTMMDNRKLQLEFQRACEEGNAQRAKELLADPHVYPNVLLNGKYSLMVAIKRSNVPLVQLLLDDPRCMNGGYSAMYWAIVYRRENIVRYLLAKEGVVPKQMSPAFNVVVTNAVISNHVGILRLLMADPRLDPTYLRCKALREAIVTHKRTMADVLFADVRVRTALYGDELLYRELRAGKTTRVETMRCLTMGRKSMEAEGEDTLTERACPEHRRVVRLATLLRDPRVCQKLPKHPMREMARAIVGFL